MLNIIYGDVKNSIYNTNVYFKNSYEPEWLETELAKKMIKDIDDSEVLSGECINSPMLGQIPPERLSGGVKTLLLILNEPGWIFNASTCGDNCAKWILEIDRMKNKENETYELYQLKDTPECRDLMFLSFDRLSRLGVPVRGSYYNKVCSGTLKSGEDLDSIYERFNMYHLDDFRGHSLSVSDVIVHHKDNRDQAYYVDSFGFRQMPEFFADNPLKKVEEMLEDDYEMIDGIINNGDRRKDDEKKHSVMDKIQEKKKEAAVAENNAPKPKEAAKKQDAELS